MKPGRIYQAIDEHPEYQRLMETGLFRLQNKIFDDERILDVAVCNGVAYCLYVSLHGPDLIELKKVWLKILWEGAPEEFSKSLRRSRATLEEILEKVPEDLQNKIVWNLDILLP